MNVLREDMLEKVLNAIFLSIEKTFSPEFPDPYKWKYLLESLNTNLAKELDVLGKEVENE